MMMIWEYLASWDFFPFIDWFFSERDCRYHFKCTTLGACLIYNGAFRDNAEDVVFGSKNCSFSVKWFDGLQRTKRKNWRKQFLLPIEKLRYFSNGCSYWTFKCLQGRTESSAKWGDLLAHHKFFLIHVNKKGNAKNNNILGRGGLGGVHRPPPPPVRLWPYIIVRILCISLDEMSLRLKSLQIN